jgi:hydroxypyruvate isomerase
MSDLAAIHARLLAALVPDAPIRERLALAREIGFAGIEIDLHDSTRAIDDWMHDLNAIGVRASALDFGDASAILHPDPTARQRALEAVRVALTDASDLRAAGVVIGIGTGAPSLPDLSPYKTSAELTLDLLNEHLRWLEDYANAMDVALLIAPSSSSPIIRSIEDAAAVIARRSDHPRLRIAADAGAAYTPQIGYARLGFAGGAPVGKGLLRASGYAGWIAAVQPENTAPSSRALSGGLPGDETAHDGSAIPPRPYDDEDDERDAVIIPRPHDDEDDYRDGVPPPTSGRPPGGGTPIGGTGSAQAASAGRAAAAGQRTTQRAILAAILSNVKG